MKIEQGTKDSIQLAINALERARESQTPDDFEYQLNEAKEEIRAAFDTFRQTRRQIGAVGSLEGERYYWMVDKAGTVSRLPADAVESEFNEEKK